MFAASLVLYVAVLLGVVLYLWFRCQRHVTSLSMLLGALWLFHGPAYIFYLFDPNTTPIFRKMAATTGFEEGIVALNLSLALMFVCIILGAEVVTRVAKTSAAAADTATEKWGTTAPTAGPVGSTFFLALVYVLAAGMLLVSVSENQLGTILQFLASSDKDAVRLASGGSDSYLYRLVLAGVAPLIGIWCLVRWRLSGGVLLAVATLVVLAAILLGKAETLQKANIPLFIIQIAVAFFLLQTNKISWKAIVILGIISLTVLAPVVIIAVTDYERDGVLGFLYYRMFDIPNEVLIEHFAAFPQFFSHTWGTSIRPLASMLGQPFLPTYDTVAFLWRVAPGSTSTTMFIGDAWDAFSYFGVFGFSLAAGIVCRGIDVVFLRHGKTALSVAVLSASFLGVYNLLISGFHTSALSGGLLLSPLLAYLVTVLAGLSSGRVVSAERSTSAPN